MIFLIWALALFIVSGAAALVSHRSPRLATRLGVGGAVVGSLLGMIPTLPVLLGAPPESFRAPWSVPYGAFYVEIDALSAFFLLPVLGLSALAAVYGGPYLLSMRDKKSLGPPWFFFNMLTAGMVLVVIARNAVLFITAWEVMSLASFFLVTFNDEQQQVREAGWTYLVATHLGTAFLLALFILLGRASGSLDFDTFTAVSAPSVIFLLALVGFGTKAGIIPFHVWLPEAHPAAPSHVSAVMSGVMIKTGIYGLVRTLTFLGAPPLWWGGLLVSVGLVSGILGVVYALAQHDLKRLLAYHSVENIGIIILGLGIGVIGLSVGSPVVAMLGFAGGMLHVLNHALFKGLLFLGAGAVAHGAGTRNIDHLGGLMKYMPWTGTTFLIGAAAISGLPTLNGFISEFLIYASALYGVIGDDPTLAVASLSVIAGLALIGGLAAACFTKAFGIVFLGEARSVYPTAPHEIGYMMRFPLILLACGCIGGGVFAPFIVRALLPTLQSMIPLSSQPAEAFFPFVSSVLMLISAVTIGGFLLIGLFVLLRRRLLTRRPVGETVTWDCGYAHPSPRMQYTASSFAAPITMLFEGVLRRHHALKPPEEMFPRQASLHIEASDSIRENLYEPVFHGIRDTLAGLRWLQHGRIQLYILYIAMTAITLLVWHLR